MYAKSIGIKMSYLERQKFNQKSESETKHKKDAATPAPAALPNIARTAVKSTEEWITTLQTTVLRSPVFCSARPTQCLALPINNHQEISDIQKKTGGYLGSEVRCTYDEKGRSTRYLVLKFQSVSRCEQTCEALRDLQPRFVHPPNKVIFADSKRRPVAWPESTFLRDVIDKTARAFAAEGAAVGEQLTGSSDQIFDFLRYKCYEAQFFRWRVYSYLMGDSEKNYETKSFRMTAEAEYQIVPPSATDQKSAHRVLSHSSRWEWARIVQELTTKRKSIAEGMVFAVRNQSKAPEIVISLCESAKTNPVATMYLISDILHNGLMLGYHGLFRAALPETMFELRNMQQYSV